MAFSENLAIRCTATIIAPRWAIASYSCIAGATEFISGRTSEINWSLFAGSSKFTENITDDKQIQRIKIKQILTYPQVCFLHSIN